MTGCTVRRYEQLETSPETIEQELRSAVCERRLTDRLKENYSIDIVTSGRGEHTMYSPFTTMQGVSRVYIYIYIINSQDTVIDNIIAILYECEMCAV